ncbi:glycosyltransferase [Almyronema epifaneia]|uniref:Glycosyltransferase n=1 Tax=Almyronema epifaneia S1 TaxID=2991925 RepID=A0ABW6IL71_9CYAN
MTAASASSLYSLAELPQVSVIVPVYNGERDLPELLPRLMQQTYPRDRVAYWLVDNASRDRTPSLIQAAAQQAQRQGIQLQLLQETDIQSAYAARNTGIRAAQGEILAFTDADCYPQPDWLINLVQPFKQPQIGLAVGEIVAFPGRNWLEKYAERKQLLSQRDTLAHPFCPYGQTANLAVRVNALEQVGLFRPHLTTGGDADLCWRLQQGGWQLQFVETAVIQHRHRSSLKELYSQWHRYGRSNRFLHELHGVDLARSLSRQEIQRQLLRWLAKDLPKATFHYLTGKGPAIDLLMTPIGLYCARARDLGQQEAQLPEAAQQIAWLSASTAGKDLT